MASIPVTIVGVMTYTGLEVGGGPMPGGPSVMPPIYYPPAGGGQPPLGIWGPPTIGHHPAHPIAPGGLPPHVAPPIYYPPQVNIPLFPTQLPVLPGGGGGGGGGGNPGNVNWEWVFIPGQGWQIGLVPGDKPQPGP